MRNLKLCLLFSAVVFFCLPKLCWAEFAFVPKLGKVGVGVPGCGTEDEQYTVKKTGDLFCLGYRLDYIEYNTNLAFAYSTIRMNFDDDFVKSYERSVIRIGYRIDLDSLLKFLGKEEPVFILSSLFLTLYPLVYGRESFVTRDYKYEAPPGRERSFDIGWRFNKTWDLFLFSGVSTVGPFLVPTSYGVEKKFLTVNESYLGLHYAFP